MAVIRASSSPKAKKRKTWHHRNEFALALACDVPATLGYICKCGTRYYHVRKTHQVSETDSASFYKYSVLHRRLCLVTVIITLGRTQKRRAGPLPEAQQQSLCTLI